MLDHNDCEFGNGDSKSGIYDSVIDEVVERLKRCESLLFITGAGVSAESGIPTYRGVGGLYNGAATQDGMSIEEALSGGMLASNPHITWRYLRQIGEAVAGKQHNVVHQIIANFEQELPRVWTLTQNIDGFHKSAGSKNVIEILGCMDRLRCVRCDLQLSKEDKDFELVLRSLDGTCEIPHCPSCRGLIRPDVVLFGESLPELELAQLQNQLALGFDAVISIGTSSLFHYIQAPVRLAKRAGKFTLEINLDHTDISNLVDEHIRARSGVAMKAIWDRFRQNSN